MRCTEIRARGSESVEPFSSVLLFSVVSSRISSDDLESLLCKKILRQNWLPIGGVEEADLFGAIFLRCGLLKTASGTNGKMPHARNPDNIFALIFELTVIAVNVCCSSRGKS